MPLHPVLAEIGPDRQKLRQGPVGQISATRSSLASVVLLCRPELEIIPGYHLVELLGAGDHGEVWKARGPEGGFLALKVLPLARPCPPAEVEDLDRMKQVHHPSLLPCVGAWQTQGHLIIGMELADGTLMDRLEECLAGHLAGIPFAELIQDMREAAAGIDFLNEGSHPAPSAEPILIQHLDIKPQNLLVVGGHVRVGGYGLARYTHHSLITNTGSTTLAYASPEVLGDRPGHRSDQYSLAAACCLLRTGRPPFSGRGAKLILGHLTQAPDLAMLPRDEADVLGRALAKNPDERWPSCRALVEALARCKGSVISPTSPTPAATEQATDVPQGVKHGWLRGWRAAGLWKKPWPWVVAVLLLLLIVEILVAVWGAWRPRVDPQTPDHGGAVVQQEKAGEALAPTLLRCPDIVLAVACSRDGRMIAGGSYDRAVTVWERTTGNRLLTLSGHTGPITGVAFAPDGQRIVSGSLDGKVKVWDARTGSEVRSLEGHTSGVTSVALDPTGARIVSGSQDSTVKVWDAGSGAELLTWRGHQGPVFCVAFGPDGGQVASAGQDWTVRVWDSRTGGSLRTLKGHRDLVTSVAFSPDGLRLVSGSWDRTVKVWDLQTGAALLTLTGHRDLVTRVAVRPDGDHVVSASADGTLTVWDARTGAQLRTLTGHQGPVHDATWIGDGRWVVSAGADRTIRVWEVAGQQ